ncbi:helix-turn-helix domain-containing protein [Fulvivirga aurantia]|uniref:helix-turn-helix domain-containing protein n=1 Tax=Fulvivirga aurantia TaxID=2529383 RepID=UPI001FE7C3A2|nr:helix-turn-helix domain-containing protein [Fulvivirga aurantia]
MFFAIVDIWFMPAMDRIQYVSENFNSRIMPYNYARAIHILVYGLLIIATIGRNYRNLNGKKRLYSLILCAIYFLAAVFVSWLTEYAVDWRQFAYYYLFSCSSILVMAFLLYTEPDFLTKITKKYLSSSLSKQDMRRIKGKIEGEIRDNQLFLRRDLTIVKLSDLISEKPHSISQTLSEEVNESFNDYLNKHRIDHAKKLLHSDDFGHYKVEAIAIESGFNNKVTFNKAFSKFTGMTPSSFRTQKRVNKKL